MNTNDLQTEFASLHRRLDALEDKLDQLPGSIGNIIIQGIREVPEVSTEELEVEPTTWHDT